MDRLPGCLALLPLLAVLAQGSPATPKVDSFEKAGLPAKSDDGGHRVIVSFADRRDDRGRLGLLEKKVLELGTKPGVLQAKALRHLGMAVVSCASAEVEEHLVRELEEDPLVALATPDTVVRFDAAAAPARSVVTSRAPKKDLRQCSAQPRCAAMNLVGEQGSGKCCPASDGLMLACCDQTATQSIIALKSFFGKYVAAEADGSANAMGEGIGAQEKFELLHNDDGSVSLRSHYGKYVAAEAGGGLNADRDLISDWEKFELVRNADGTVAFKTFHGTYFVAEPDGRLNADRREIDDWEKFTMTEVEGPSERFPDDANFTALWGMHNERGTDIDAPEAWKTFTGEHSAGIVVGVIDTGIDYTHEDLSANMWTNPGEIPGNGIDDDDNGFVDDVYGADFRNEDGDPMDDQRHGTHCAGTIAGIGNNALGVTGVAWRGVRLMALKFLSSQGSGRTSDAVKAIEYAIAHGAKILSNSWGSPSSSAGLREAIARAESSGILFVAAAGNHGTDNDNSPHYPSSYPVESVVSVASTDIAGKLSSFSCYGARSVDLAAPGTRIFSTVPHQSYKYLSGTSMATPHVSGLAALVWMYRPALSLQQVKEVLMKTVDPLEALEGKMITGGRINAKKALDMAAALEPMYPPIHAPRAIAFEDVNPKVGVIGGVVTITAAAVESDVEYYKVYWLSRAGFPLDVLGNVTADGSKLLEVPVPNSTVVPKFAAGFVAVSGNATGEMPARLGLAPSVTVKDYGVPDLEPAAVEWKGDEDMRSGIVAGSLSVARALNESSITQYNVYWSEGAGAGSRGPLLGSLAAIGFVAPHCTGNACSLINRTSKIGWHQFNRLNYGNNELATIAFTGPGTLQVTRFDTESYYDTLKIGTSELSGHPQLPIIGKLGNGPMSAKWFSDDSINAGGWTFSLTQTEARAEFRIAAGRPLGRGLEVVPSYDGTEMPKGVFVEVADYDSTMPPSPAFAPASIRFEDVDGLKGVVAGVAKVRPAGVAAANRSVTYYQLNFAASDGSTIGRGWRADAGGSGDLSVTIAATKLPPKAVQLVARAGNRFGLGVGRAAADLKDFVKAKAAAAAGSFEATERSAILPQGLDFFVAGSRAPEAEEEDEAAPWLPASPAVERRTVWTAPSPVAGRHSARGSRVLSALAIDRMDVAVAARPEARKAFHRAMAAALPRLEEEDVKITRVLAEARPEPRAEAGAAASKAWSAVVELTVEPARGAPAEVLDRVEARLILLSKRGAFSSHFEKALLAELSKLGTAAPAGARVAVRAPQQLAAEGRSRSLAAAAPEVVPDGDHTASLQAAGDQMGAAFVALAAAGLAAVSACGAASFAVCKIGKHLVRGEGSASEPLHALETGEVKGASAAH